MRQINARRYAAIKARLLRYQAAWDAYDPKRSAKGGGYNAAEQKAIVRAAKLRRAPTNDERGAVEVYEFCRDRPDAYVLYVDKEKGVATTWNGYVLGRVALGRRYQVGAYGRPSERRSVTVFAINGRVYSGTYYCSSGSYARVKASDGLTLSLDHT